MTEAGLTEKSVKVAFLGPAGTFSQAAVDRHFGPAADKLSMAGIDDVFLAVEKEQANYGVVPVENSTEGAVNYTQDCLMDTSLSIVAEVVIAIEHNFLMQHASALAGIKRVVSHRQSLAQCRAWLKLNWPGIALQEVSSNAEAARLAAEDIHTAAIASETAAINYGLFIHTRNIQDRRDNSTRFLVLAQNGIVPAGKAKTSILVYTENKPGALFRVLEPFEKYQVSLTKIETRPARDDMWAYVFFIDFEGSIDEPAVKNVFSQLKNRAVKIKNLGSYPMAIGQ